MSRPSLLLVLVAALTLPAPSAAQEGHAGHGGHAAHADSAAASPYADMTGRSIAALSAEEAEGLRRGDGLGMALPAELNGWPGPKHVLELVGPLELTAAQRESVEAIRARMTERAVALGERVIDAEAALDALFADGTAEVAAVEAAAVEVGRLRGALRAAHLLAHLATREVLAAEQVEAYQRLRGYAPGRK